MTPDVVSVYDETEFVQYNFYLCSTNYLTKNTFVTKGQSLHPPLKPQFFERAGSGHLVLSAIQDE